MKLYDPHDDGFCAKNLREEEWYEYQRDEETLELVETIKTAFANGNVARVSRDNLYAVGFMVSATAGTSAVLMQSQHHDHWAALAICMLSRGSFKMFEKEEVYRFYKSKHEQEPMYWNNVIWIQPPNIRYAYPERREVETETTGTPRHGQNDQTSAISGKRTGKGDSTGQASLFDFH